MIAAYHGQVEVVQELIKNGADINTKSNLGKIIASNYLMHSIFLFCLFGYIYVYI